MRFLITLLPGNWTGEKREFKNPFKPDSTHMMSEPVNVPLDRATMRRAWDTIEAFAKEQTSSSIHQPFTTSLDFELRNGRVVTVAPNDWSEDAPHMIQFYGKGPLPSEVADLTWRVMEVTSMAVVGGEAVVARSEEVLARAPENFRTRRLCSSAAELVGIFEETPELWE